MNNPLQLKSDWKIVLHKAWSVRFIILAGMLSCFEVVLPYFSDSLDNKIFSILSGVAAGAALVARLLAQKDLSNEE